MKKTRKSKPADCPKNLLEQRLADFCACKSKENYVRFLETLHRTDILIPAAAVSDTLPFGNNGILEKNSFKPDVIFLDSLKKKVMPVFSDQTKLPLSFKGRKTVFMHCSDWLKAFHSTGCDGVVLNPFSETSFFLTPDQLRVLSFFPSC